MPISAVPPSPAKPTTVQSSGFFPCARKPASIPVSTAAVAAKGVIIALFAKHSWGKLKPTALMHPAGSAATAFGPSTFSAARTASEPPHPAHALCPKNSSSAGMFFAFIATIAHLLHNRRRMQAGSQRESLSRGSSRGRAQLPGR